MTIKQCSLSLRALLHNHVPALVVRDIATVLAVNPMQDSNESIVAGGAVVAGVALVAVLEGYIDDLVDVAVRRQRKRNELKLMK